MALHSSLLSADVAIDLGTENTLVFVKDRGIVLDEPSVVAVGATDGEIIATGHRAKEMIGRTPRDVRAIRPLRDGVIADLWAAERMLGEFLRPSRGVFRRRGARAVVGVPSDTTQVERSAVACIARLANVSRVDIVEETYAAAVGAGLSVSDPYGRMIVDIGAGTTDVAVISLDGTVFSHAERVGGSTLDEAIITYMKRRHGLVIGETTAERVKIRLGSACPLPVADSCAVTGRSLHTGAPATVLLSDAEVRETIAQPVDLIVRAVRTALERVPPELSADIFEEGLHLTGGGALLRGLTSRLEHETGLRATLVDEPLAAVALGAGKML